MIDGPVGIWIKIDLNPRNNWVHFLNFFILSGPRGFRQKNVQNLDSMNRDFELDLYGRDGEGSVDIFKVVLLSV
jgi:hypothetical protein